MDTPVFDAPMVLGAQIEARARHPEVAQLPFAVQGDRSWSYRRFRDESVRVAHFLLARLGRLAPDRPGHVAMLLENHLELLALYGGCGYGGLTLFGVNTGLRGDTLAGVINESRSPILIVDERLWPEVERVRGDLKHVAPEDLLVLRTAGGAVPPESDLALRLEEEVGPIAEEREPPAVEVAPDTNLMVIYTSGTTGLPKGINNNHAKLCLIGTAIRTRFELGPGDVGYACMPLFHSNAMFLCVMGNLIGCGSFALRERFSASSFVPDVLRHGVTWWNYVGEPVHYVLTALEKQYGGEEARIVAEVARHPRNRMRFALGNGASPPDIDRFVSWLGLDDMYELYGSTEAAISTMRTKEAPRGSVGEIDDANVKVLDEDGRECPPAELDASGRLLNYTEAVGEICRVAPDSGLFQGYFGNPDATSQKYREGVYHSGDLGHILIRDGKRYLFFDGRTDDWIRKDGENFSALPVARHIQEHPDVLRAAAYGAPCVVSDELVMVAVQLREGASLDPQEFWDFCEERVGRAGMDRKWFPDFVRVVDDFELTQTEKILVRSLKKVHFDLRRLPDAEIYWRQRGDAAFRRFKREDYEALRKDFEASERVELLDR
jgi:fatty-acyl-CoA synthase